VQGVVSTEIRSLIDSHLSVLVRTQYTKVTTSGVSNGTSVLIDAA